MPSMEIIDLRSDTVTRPTAAMREAMAKAEVGDDVYGEDPTVNRLQDMLAEMAGFEAGLLMPTGTMSNLVAMLTHADRGEEVIVPAGAHVYNFELGGMAVAGGLVPREVPAPLGVPSPADVRAAIQRSVHVAPPGLIVVENTHNRSGGTVVDLEACRAVADVAADESLPLHLDGARAFNAAAAMRVPLDQVCAPFDSASLCLSKGLGAPAGTVLLGSADFVRSAHRYRKLLGGGMRQAGVIAAAGIVAVTQMAGRLHEDHERARLLADGLAGVNGVRIDLRSVQTNMVYAEVDDAAWLVSAIAEAGVRAGTVGRSRVRFVTHHQVDDAGVRRAVEAVARACERRAA